MSASAQILKTTTDFPADWPVRSAASFAPFITSGSRGWARYYSETGDLFMRITNLDRSTIYPDLSDRQHVALPETERERLRTGLSAGDILISITADIGIIGYVDERIPLPAYINQHVACLRLQQDQVCPKFVAYYLASAAPQKRFVERTDVGAKTGINLTTVSRLTFPCPALPEQQVIAAALSDADGVVAGLARVIAKKRLIKQGAMQDLLTARRRLPGFSGEWEVKKLGDLMSMKSGDAITSASIQQEGDYPVFGANGLRGFTSSFNRDDECTLVGRQGALCGVVTHTVGKIFASEHAIVCKATTHNCQRFISHRLDYADLNKVSESSAQPGLSVEKIKKIEIEVPLDGLEQNAIADVLSDMDAEIQTLEARLAKARAVKDGMMQNLLTGRIRLV